MTVRDILVGNGGRIVAVHRHTPVLSVAERMRRAGVSALVVSRDGREIGGFVSKHDVLRALVAQGVGGCMAMTAADIMSWPVTACRPEDSLRQVLAIMTRRRVRYMPVVDDGDLCGIVGIDDVVRHRLQEAETAADVARDAFTDAR